MISNDIIFLSLMNIFFLANSEDPDEMPHLVAFHLSLHCFCQSIWYTKVIQSVKQLFFCKYIEDHT